MMVYSKQTNHLQQANQPTTNTLVIWTMMEQLITSKWHVCFDQKVAITI
jgi:hypothetical protein